MPVVDMLPGTLDIDAYAGTDVRVCMVFEQQSAPGYLDLTGTTIQASIVSGQTLYSATVDMTNASTGVVILKWSDTQTTSLSDGEFQWYLDVHQGDYDWTPVTGTFRVKARP